MKYLFSLILLNFIFASPQINLHYTDWINESESNYILQHNCLRIAVAIDKNNIYREITSYCMNELPSKFHIEKHNSFPKFTFGELSKRNITSQQLYLWLTPIDIVERYQFYLNQLSTSDDKSLETQVFYNCTFPRFGPSPMCQYEMNYYYENQSSLYDIIHDYYNRYPYDPTTLTCYIHLQCNRGPFPLCIYWREICDGQNRSWCESELNNSSLCNNALDSNDWCEDEREYVFSTKKNISFQIICDGFVGVFPKTIEGKIETDETECEQWSCNNIHTYCDGIWNCPHGEDEIDCYSFSKLNCSLDHHLCVLPDTNQLVCLSIEKINDGKIDCLGATNEPTLCPGQSNMYFGANFYCTYRSRGECISSLELCNNKKICDQEDEQFCVKNRSVPIEDYVCHRSMRSLLSDVEKFLCRVAEVKIRQILKYFSLDGIDEENNHMFLDETKTMLSKSSTLETRQKHQHQCHRGFDLRVWLNDEKNLTINTCFCPPSYYGAQCQYQNQRVSLTIKFRALSDSWSTLFAIIISLIDDIDEKIIHSYEQFTYLLIRDCKEKFNIYLLYSTRSKNQTKNYAIHIDIYEKVSLSHRGSLLFPIIFPFLPVYCVAYKVDISRKNEHIKSCSNSLCIHGKCIMDLNKRSFKKDVQGTVKTRLIILDI
ncbi:unnamed protein product [Rotaria sp. Silwood2]|nr:unnamed protein product [Rotaria sp. Silwood2]CAF2931689.1 unnamed protein product [Rotaria sp. Silwood2]CAF3338083.1 unnamed protein product [Rotaria sp. Silwood2]CAF4454954.1 unnamed protein product [Rotaria sp. Silwood2]CAF4479948.1 unnamed protein product [Rotaria sp. Silwood2]